MGNFDLNLKEIKNRSEDSTFVATQGLICDYTENLIFEINIKILIKTYTEYTKEWGTLSIGYKHSSCLGPLND